MHLYQCPACDCLPVRYKKRPSSSPRCIRCGRYLIKKSRIPSGYLWAFGLSALAVLILFVPHLMEMVNKRSQDPSFPTLTGSLGPRAILDRSTAGIEASDLLSKLEDADLQWLPREELLPDGSTRFLYKRRAGEPDLSVRQLRALLDDPPTFQVERKAIQGLLDSLRQAGVRVMLTPTAKSGAAAEWDHGQGVVRIQPHMTGKGSVDFLRVLNHEAIHVAQSCRAGSVHARPTTLGLPPGSGEGLPQTLRDPMYARASSWEKRLEVEAYGWQNDINTAKNLVDRECGKQALNVLNQP